MPTPPTPTAASAGPQENFCLGGYGAPKIYSSLVPPNLVFLPTPLALLSLEASVLMGECGEISALTRWLEYSGWFVIVLQASLEVLREACACRYSHEHIYYLQIYT